MNTLKPGASRTRKKKCFSFERSQCRFLFLQFHWPRKILGSKIKESPGLKAYRAEGKGKVPKEEKKKDSANLLLSKRSTHSNRPGPWVPGLPSDWSSPWQVQPPSIPVEQAPSPSITTTTSSGGPCMPQWLTSPLSHHHTELCFLGYRPSDVLSHRTVDLHAILKKRRI
jgi:hypothetical protein